MLRKQLEKEFGEDLSGKKELIREEVRDSLKQTDAQMAGPCSSRGGPCMSLLHLHAQRSRCNIPRAIGGQRIDLPTTCVCGRRLTSSSRSRMKRELALGGCRGVEDVLCILHIPAAAGETI